MLNMCAAGLAVGSVVGRESITGAQGLCAQRAPAPRAGQGSELPEAEKHFSFPMPNGE